MSRNVSIALSLQTIHPCMLSDLEWEMAISVITFIPATFRKLGRLALGLKRSDIDKLSIDSFTDFVAEFSQISNWTLGQVRVHTV